eukprot:CAMPEP_0174235526 /NCGR_PEP_ID=MMETSP0417-20130205/4935_1 /TAXON_ID=242541 /ORGANISM="Mayorella sp, Strain BSH-02190019" /LENGTH=149 /DNA_ID=CAMNT_0015314035 /DNA_START=50 /DNA_END=496 /DNA_ORIENTATION=-
MSIRNLKSEVRSGWVTKEGSKHRTWRHRYLVLTPQDLRYYADENESKLKGGLLIQDCVFEDSLPDQDEKKGLFGAQYYYFAVTSKPIDGVSSSTLDRRRLLMRVRTATERAQWIAALQKAKRWLEGSDDQVAASTAVDVMPASETGSST